MYKVKQLIGTTSLLTLFVLMLSISLIWVLSSSYSSTSKVLGRTTSNEELLTEINPDTTPPLLNFSQRTFKSDSTFVEKFMISNEKIELIGNEDLFNINEISKRQNPPFIYSIEIIDTSKAYAKDVDFVDESSNKSTTTLFFNINKIEFKESGEKSCMIKNNQVDILSIEIDRNNCISKNFEKSFDFIPFTHKDVTVNINSIIFNDLKRLLNDANQDEIVLYFNSSYRDYEAQVEINERFLKYYGDDLGELLSASPGHSEHQLGTAIDFSSQEVKNGLVRDFTDTKAFEWLNNNAWKHGFVLSYPEGKEEITGYSFESWHWRYIGIEQAKDLHEMPELTLREYLFLSNHKER